MLYLQQFLDHLKTNRYAESSISNYKVIFKKANTYFLEQGIKDEREITETHITKYLQYMKEDQTSDWVYYTSIIYLKVYFKYLEAEGIVFISPLTHIEIPKWQGKHIKILQEDEISNIFNQIDTSTDNGIRSRAILELMYSSALRTGEVANIKIGDIDFKKKILFIRMAKKKKDRVVPVLEKAIEWIEKYLQEVRPKYVREGDEGYLFLPFKGKRKKMKFQSIYYGLQRTFLKDHIKWFRPYSLRPSSATHCLHNGMDILHLQKLLGHANPRTTQIYLRVNTFELQKAIGDKHPANRKRHKKKEDKNEI